MQMQLIWDMKTRLFLPNSYSWTLAQNMKHCCCNKRCCPIPAGRLLHFFSRSVH